ncbi:MAG: ThuA domain-containing protein [Candidatus Hydrogenedentes bacterium]|nr:ThuA domain-containing protein [Candidatus Hydrogenedentota bacterium]
MRSSVVWLCVVALLAFATSQAAAAQHPLRLLVVTGGHGFDHDPFFDLFKTMPGVEYTEAVQPAANALYTREAAKSYDVVVLYDMVQEISDEQKQDLVRLLKKDGKGLVAIHHSMANYLYWPEFRKILGGRYYTKPLTVNGVEHSKSGYEHDVHFTVQIADPKHPITKGMKDFELVDETYSDYDIERGITPLLKVNHPKSAPVIAWTNKYGKARIVVIQSGHGPTAYSNPNYRQILENAIRWAGGK